MKITYKDFGFECSIEEINALVGLFNADISNAVDALREKMDFKVKVENEGTEERNDISEPTEVEVPKRDVVWITNTQLMREFNLRSTSTLHSHIKQGFTGYRQSQSGRRTILIDRDAFAQWYAKHNNEGAKGARGHYETKKKIFVLENPEEFDKGWQSWASEMRNRCIEEHKEPGKIFSEVYRRLTKDYGIVFDQLKKEFREATGESSRSKIELIFWLQNTQPVYEKMFEGVLTTVLKEVA